MEYGDVTLVDDLRSLELRPRRMSVYDQEIGMRRLYEDSQTGADHYLVRYPAGMTARPHRHTAAHTIVVLDGSLEANGTVVGPGSYAHFPAGEVMHHAPAGDSPCLFVIIFHGPSDVEPVAG